MKKIELEVSEENEATRSPWWVIIDPRQNFEVGEQGAHNVAAMITGPFFSREEGAQVLRAQRYNFSKHAVVYCLSGHNATQYGSKVQF